MGKRTTRPRLRRGGHLPRGTEQTARAGLFGPLLRASLLACTQETTECICGTLRQAGNAGDPGPGDGLWAVGGLGHVVLEVPLAEYRNQAQRASQDRRHLR